MTEVYESFEIDAIEKKKKILREGVWEPYTLRIKNLEKAEEKLWELYESDCDVECKRKILENVIDLQSIIANCYNSSQKVLEQDESSGVCK